MDALTTLSVYKSKSAGMETRYFVNMVVCLVLVEVLVKMRLLHCLLMAIISLGKDAGAVTLADARRLDKSGVVTGQVYGNHTNNGDYVGEVFSVSEILSTISFGRPILGYGSRTIYMFVDFEEPASLVMLADLIQIVRRFPQLRMVVIFYAPSRTIQDQAVATFSTAAHKILRPQPYFVYLENMARHYGHHKDSIYRSIKRARVSMRAVMAATPSKTQEAAKIIEENNKLGYTLTKANGAPVMVVNNKIINTYLNKAQIKTLILQS